LRKILYLVKDPNPVRTDLLASDQTSDREVWVVLLQDGVSLTDLPTNRVYVLSDDVHARHITPPYPVISYADVLRMMFEADAVIAL
jgi:sulfur transfer complex TusBCD TusB component (DsrH family)